MDHRQIIRVMSCARIAVGAGLLLSPGAFGSGWMGPAARRPATKLAIRSLGVRDLAIGVGTFQALAEGESVRPWVMAGAASDVVDGVASLLALREVGLRRAIPAVVVALTFGVYAASVVDQVDPV
jgi:hypothetical protein